jgi:hypothetical protein
LQNHFLCLRRLRVLDPPSFLGLVVLVGLIGLGGFCIVETTANPLGPAALEATALGPA